MSALLFHAIIAITDCDFYMGYNSLTSLAGITGKFAGAFTASVVPGLAVIGEDKAYTPGTVIPVTERFTFRSNITDPSLVDVDTQWYAPHYYLGSLQLNDVNGNYCSQEWSQVYLNSLVQCIEIKSFIVIGLGQIGVVYNNQAGTINNCNFFLEPSAFIEPGTTQIKAGFQLYKNDAVLQFSSGIISFGISPFDFIPAFSGYGVVLKPGVEAVSAQYDAFADTFLAANLNPAPNASCTFFNPDCDALFLAFLAQQPGVRFISVAAAEAFFAVPASELMIDTLTYVCLYSPFTSYPYFKAQLLPTCTLSFLSQQATYKAAGVQNLHKTQANAIAAGAAYDLIDPPPPGVNSFFTTLQIPIVGSPPGLNCTGWLVFQQWVKADGSAQIRNNGPVFFANLP